MKTTTMRLALLTTALALFLAFGAQAAGASGWNSPVVRSHQYVTDPSGPAYSQGAVLFHLNGQATVDPSIIRDGGPTARWAVVQIRTCTTSINCTGWVNLASTPHAYNTNPGAILVYKDGGIRSVAMRMCNDQGSCSGTTWYSR